MSKPANFGVIVYAKNIQLLSNFYIDMFGLSVIHKTTELVSLVKDDVNIVIHTPPIDLPDNNFNNIKAFITVNNLEEAKRKSIELGGRVLEGEWSNSIFKLCNIIDPEGNHIQLREFIA